MSVGAPERTGTDRFAEVISRRVGGPLGRRAGSAQGWFTPIRIALLTATLTWIVCAIQKVPCRTLTAGNYPNTYERLCYSDITLLYTSRGLADGNTPYLDVGNYQSLEYPVLTGWLLEFNRVITVLLGAPVGPGLSEQQAIDAARLFGDVNLVVLGGLFLLTVWAQFRTTPLIDDHDPRRWDAMMLAASPCVVLAGFINWDMLPIALTALGFLFWARRRSAWAGVMFGLGMAAKLYPALLLGPLLLLCLRAGKMREFGKLMIGFVVSWLVVNLPVLILAPGQWMTFWTFNSDRQGDLGSIWYVLALAGHPVPHLNTVAMGLLVIMCAGIGWLIMTAERRPRFGQVAYLVILAFLITNKVYSPQYVLWLLPLLILARPRWREWWIFTFGEVCYYLAIWAHLDQSMVPGDGGPDRVYWLAVIVRIACELWVGAMIIRDILHPDRDDPLRAETAAKVPDPVEGPGRNPQVPDPVEGPGRNPKVPEPVEGPVRNPQGPGPVEGPVRNPQGPGPVEGPVRNPQGPEPVEGSGRNAQGPGPVEGSGRNAQGPGPVEGHSTSADSSTGPSTSSGPLSAGSGSVRARTGPSTSSGPLGAGSGPLGAGSGASGFGSGPAGSGSGSSGGPTRRVIYGPVTADDPTGGVLDGAPDVGWVRQLRAAVAGGRTTSG